MHPPLNAVRAFDAVARHLSFKQAAQELCVTQGAVSRHVQRLEAFLGVVLLVRGHRHLTLTDAGLAYSREVHAALATLSQATSQVISSARDRATLRIKLPPTCALRWFIPRLSRFHAIHADITVNIVTSHGDVDFAKDDVDAAIQYGPDAAAGVAVEKLIDEELILVCSRKLAEAGPGISRPQDLVWQVLLKSGLRPGDWPNWFEAVGLPRNFATQGEIVLENAALTYEGAAKGLGVALAQRAFVEEDLRSGELVAPIDQRLASPTGYFLLIPQNRASLGKVRAFRDWIVPTARERSPLPAA